MMPHLIYEIRSANLRCRMVDVSVVFEAVLYDVAQQSKVCKSEPLFQKFSFLEQCAQYLRYVPQSYAATKARRETVEECEEIGAPRRSARRKEVKKRGENLDIKS